MKSPAVVAIAIILMSGCASIFAAPQSAMDAEPVTTEKARELYDDPMFLGMFALDGSIDVDAMKATIEEEAQEEGVKTDFLEAFDFNVRNGEYGDGLAGSWFSAYAPAVEWDEDELLVVQAVGGSTNHFIFSEESMVAQQAAQGTLATNLLGHLGLMQESTIEPCQSGSKITTTIDSPEAARIAHEQEDFSSYVDQNPGLDYFYAYVPSFVDCDGDWEDGDMWAVGYTDADAWAQGEEADGAIVFMDGNGDPFEMFPVFEEISMWATSGYGSVTGVLPSAVSGPATETFEVTVAQGTYELFGYVIGDFDVEATDANGNAVEFVTEDGLHQLILDNPAAGTMTVTISFEHVTPSTRDYQYDFRGWY